MFALAPQRFPSDRSGDLDMTPLLAEDVSHNLHNAGTDLNERQ